MAGKKRRVAEKDYDALIQASESKIEKWTNDIKEERKTLKQLKKDKERFEEQKAVEDAEKEKGLTENIVAIDAIVIVTDTQNKVDNLTTQQLIDIYKGKIRNWKEVGGEDLPIVVIGRESGSGTRSAFEEILNIEEQCQYANEINETGPIIAKVQSIPGAIGYVSLDVIDETVKPLSIDGVQASEETIQNGQYSLQRPFVMATRGAINQQNENIQHLFQFIQSEDGQKIIRAVGLVPVSRS